MSLILHITSKDLLQMLRDRKTFLFLLLMPIAFTLLFGFAFSNTGQDNADQRLPVGLLNLDGAAPLSLELERMLSVSVVLRVETMTAMAGLEQALAEKKLAAAVIIPAGYGAAVGSGEPLKLLVLADPASSAGQSVQTEIGVAAGRLTSALHTARALAPGGGAELDAAMQDALAAWQSPPVRTVSTYRRAATPEVAQPSTSTASGFAHSSPGMILQFAVAGLLTCAQTLIAERKNRCLQRLLTTSASRWQILLGHYLSIFLLLFAQFAILILFGQVALKLDYLSQPLATLLVALSAALCIAALGLLIGALARSEEQAIAFSLICMFLLAGLGGAWVPLEATGGAFQAIGRLSPLAWAMDGFKNVLVRGLGVQAALLPAAALLAYAGLFFGLATWRFEFE